MLTERYADALQLAWRVLGDRTGGGGPADLVSKTESKRTKVQLKT